MAEEIRLTLQDPLLRAARDVARSREISLQQLLKDALNAELKRVHFPAKTPNRADEQLVARLQRLLVPEMASAMSWADLAHRLREKGYALRPAGGGLTLHDAGGTRLCKSSELGFAYSRLVRKFQAPMPGHPHRMQHILNENAAGEDPDGALVLFEPF
jgi:hypothetical protein